LYGSVSFTPNGNTSPRLGTGDGGNAVGWLPGASFFVTMPIGEKFRVGLGTFSYFGSALDYGDTWVGRYYAQKSALLGLSVMPSVSFKVTDWLSVGAGMNAMYGYLHSHVAVNNLFGPDGQMSLKDVTWGFGADAGLLVQVDEKTRFGVTYLSRVNLDFKARPSFSGLGPVLGAILANPAELNLGVTVPQSVMVSGYHALNDQWSVMADFGWQDWSQFSDVQVGVESVGTRTLNLKYQDTWHGAIGAQYHASEQWVFSGGVAFDSSAVDSENRTVTVPMGQAWRFGLGVQYQLSQKINIGIAETFLWLGSMSVDQGSELSLRGRVSGSYNNAWSSVTALSMTWKF
jgi:long-chain fatty acid transport protein